MSLRRSNKVKSFFYNFHHLKMFIFKSNYRYANFKYSYSNFEAFSKQLNEEGVYTINIGDYIQAFAIENLYKTLGIKNLDCVDRDTLCNYKGKPLKVMMNAVIWQRNIPFKDKIWPYFLGVNLHHKNFEKMLPYLKKSEPIGCRDVSTCEKLNKFGVEAYVTGCYSMTLPKRETVPVEEKIFFVGVSDELKKHIPKHLLSKSVFVEQREPMYNYPLSEKDMEFAKNKAEELIQMYKNEATLVVTPLLHCASPCIGMGIPVILARDEDNPRFSAIKKITKLYLKEDYPNINWSPASVDIEGLKANMIEHARARLLENRVDSESLRYLNEFFLNKAHERVGI